VREFRIWTGLFCILFPASLLLAIAGQWFTGVYQNDLSQLSDEGCHYINGLLIHDYLADGLPGNPLQYALQYYVHYPRVTIGHWPPFFYLVQAGLYFIIGPGTGAALLLQAILGAGTAASVGCVVGRFGGWVAGLLASVATLAAPEIFAGMQSVMLDVPIALLTCLAMLAWARFLLEETWPWSFAFALAAAAAIMTKGNGIFLALVPPLSLVLGGRLRLLRSWRFWLPAPVVAMTTLPWYLLTYKTSASGFIDTWGHFVLEAVPEYAQLLPEQIGVVGLLFAMLGGFRVLLDRDWSWRRALGTSAVCVVVVGFAFTCVVPAGMEGRYLAPLVPALVILAYFGIEWLLRSQAVSTRTVVLGVSFLAILAAEHRFPQTTTRAMNAASKRIFAEDGNNAFILVGSTGAGEGALTAEIATRDRNRQKYVVRGFAALGSGNFMGADYRPRFETSSDVAKWIEERGIGWVVLDASPSSLSWKHNALLLEIAQSGRQGWSLAGRFPNSRGETLVYKVSLPGRPADSTELLSVIPARTVGW
jgi:Dolichyl-phosphate-mannose-protein mannosyltransferase